MQIKILNYILFRISQILKTNQPANIGPVAVFLNQKVKVFLLMHICFLKRNIRLFSLYSKNRQCQDFVDGSRLSKKTKNYCSYNKTSRHVNFGCTESTIPTGVFLIAYKDKENIYLDFDRSICMGTIRDSDPISTICLEIVLWAIIYVMKHFIKIFCMSSSCVPKWSDIGGSYK